MFQPVESNVNFPKLEEEILCFWREAGIYEKSLQRRRAENAQRTQRGEPEQNFVFYEGPPTANGMPHPGHCLTRAIKDLFPRYRTMRGYLCERKAGWDTHGLPVEVEVCKELGIHSKEDIEKFGIEPFIQKCQQSVWRYMQEWRRMTERIGFWVNLDEAYVTYHQSYVESVWWSLKQLFDRGLLYQGYKIVWWWAQGGTALSSGEVGQGYREVADPSVYVKFPLVSDERTKELGLDGASLLVWTTTPWTLPSNQFAAVHPDIKYDVIVDPADESARLIVASDRSMEVAIKALKSTTNDTGAYPVVVKKQMSGLELIGLRYIPPFEQVYYDKPGRFEAKLWTSPDELIGKVLSDTSLGELTLPVYSAVMTTEDGAQRSVLSSISSFKHIGWRVVGAQFVTTESGTGIVHQAPAFGEVDFNLWRDESVHFVPGLPFLNPVTSDGKFTDEGPEYCRGRWVKDCDKDIIHDLKNRGLLFHREEYRHEYPFCWRAEEDPLIQYPRRSWFIKTSEFKQQMLDNNQHINWLPEHIKEGRMGNFLATNVDWALSRERFWGTPLPIWQCEKTGKMEAVANYDELLQKPGIQGTEVWAAAKKANPNLADDLKVHKPYIDAVTYDSPFEKGARMYRVTEVIDCWYDSGAMPFAQWGYQGETDEPSPSGRGQGESAASSINKETVIQAIETALGSSAKKQYGQDRDIICKIDRSTGDILITHNGAQLNPEEVLGPVAAQTAKQVIVQKLREAERDAVYDEYHDRIGQLVSGIVLKYENGTVKVSLGNTEAVLPRSEQIPGETYHPDEHVQAMVFDVKKVGSRVKVLLSRTRKSWSSANRQGGGTPQKFHEQFPADFISEALDQTRGWFYSQLAISTLVFDKPIPRPFRNCIVLGLMLGEDGQKMSKSKRNYREPGEIFDKYGADALRWYFFATQPPWTTIRYSERAIRDSIPEFLLRLWHTYSFFVIYANIDGFDPLHEIYKAATGGRAASPSYNPSACGLVSADLATAKSYRPIRERSELDRWILSELNRTAAAVVELMDTYDNYTAAQRIIEFVDALSNWYVRRSRDRFWAEDKQDPDKIDAYWTLYECLLTTAKIIAPFVPFLAEAMWQNLSAYKAATGGRADNLESVHLCDFPTGDASAIDEALSAQMNLVREIASLGLSARMGAKLKVRQPLAKVEVILVNPAQQAWLENHTEVICKELNVKHVEFTQKADQYITYTVLPDLKRLGPRLGKKLPLVKNALAKADGGKLLAEMEAAGNVSLKLDDGSSEALDRDDLQVRLQAKPGWAAAQGKHCVVVLATEISPELIVEGVAREIVHAIQTARKDTGCEYTDRIEVGVVSESTEIRQAVEKFGDFIRGETLAIVLKLGPIEGVEPIEIKVGDETLRLYIRVVKK